MPATYRLIKRMEREISGFNRKQLREADMERLAEKAGIQYHRIKMPGTDVFGFSINFGLRREIVVNSELSEPMRVFAGMHEFHHNIYQCQEIRWCKPYFEIDLEDKLDLQANIVGSLAVMPTVELVMVSECCLIDEDFLIYNYGVIKDLARFRIWVMNNYLNLDRGAS